MAVKPKTVIRILDKLTADIKDSTVIATGVDSHQMFTVQVGQASLTMSATILTACEAGSVAPSQNDDHLWRSRYNRIKLQLEPK